MAGPHLRPDGRSHAVDWRPALPHPRHSNRKSAWGKVLWREGGTQVALKWHSGGSKVAQPAGMMGDGIRRTVHIRRGFGLECRSRLGGASVWWCGSGAV